MQPDHDNALFEYGQIAPFALLSPTVTGFTLMMISTSLLHAYCRAALRRTHADADTCTGRDHRSDLQPKIVLRFRLALRRPANRLATATRRTFDVFILSDSYKPGTTLNNAPPDELQGPTGHSPTSRRSRSITARASAAADRKAATLVDFHAAGKRLQTHGRSGCRLVSERRLPGRQRPMEANPCRHLSRTSPPRPSATSPCTHRAQ
jgi:hypothetical protein